MIKRYKLLLIPVLFFTGCSGLPKNGEMPTQEQRIKCERIGTIALNMMGLGAIGAAGSVAYGLAGGGQNAVPAFVGTWGIGMIGAGTLYWLDKCTGCPMP